MDIRTRYDVKGDDYAGSAYVAGCDRPRRSEATCPSPSWTGRRRIDIAERRSAD